LVRGIVGGAFLRRKLTAGWIIENGKMFFILAVAMDQLYAFAAMLKTLCTPLK
jgi:hypothetical protein